jgi:hypothetical protein
VLELSTIYQEWKLLVLVDGGSCLAWFDV